MNNVCCYQLPLKVMAQQACFVSDDNPVFRECLDFLIESGKVIYFYKEGIVWVKNYLSWQNIGSPQFMKGVANDLRKIPSPIAKAVVEFNLEKHKIEIPYRDGMDTVSIPSYKIRLDKKGGGSGEGIEKLYRENFQKLVGKPAIWEKRDEELLSERILAYGEEEVGKVVLWAFEKDQTFRETPAPLRTILSAYHFLRLQSDKDRAERDEKYRKEKRNKERAETAQRRKLSDKPELSEESKELLSQTAKKLKEGLPK